MIVITGSVMTNAENRANIEAQCIAHSQRSRSEPGCIAHNVHEDCENRDRLVFLEVWADGDAVKAHFALPASVAFVNELRARCTEPPGISIYSANELPMAALAA